MKTHKGKGTKKHGVQRRLVDDLVDEWMTKNSNKKSLPKETLEDAKDTKDLEKPKRFEVPYNDIIVGKND